MNFYVDDRPPFIQAMFNDAEWRKHVHTVGLDCAKEELAGLKAELKIQRRERLNDEDYQDFLVKQAKFEKVAAKRLAEIERTLKAGRTPEKGKRYLKDRMTHYVDLIAVLADAIDETDLEYLLEEHTIKFGHEEMTLAEALDDGRFDRRLDEIEDEKEKVDGRSSEGDRSTETS